MPVKPLRSPRAVAWTIEAGWHYRRGPSRVDEELTLTVTLRPAGLDDRRGIVRLHPEVMTALAINPGDPVRLVGPRTTAALAAKAAAGASREFLYADDLTLGNLGLRDGGRVTVARQPAVAARRV